MTNAPERTAAVTALVRRYYAALERGEPLPGFYATDEEAGAFGPVVKIGSGQGEELTGSAAVARAVEAVTATFSQNYLESRALQVRCAGRIAWFSDLVWWSGVQVERRIEGEPNAEQERSPEQEGGKQEGGKQGSGKQEGHPFASLTRWTGVCLLTASGWKLLQVHVSEGV